MAHAVVILAAGMGTRMKSAHPKVLHPLLGKPLLAYGVEAALATQPEKVVAVVGHGAAEVQAALAGYPLEFVVQQQQLGTAHALLQAKAVLHNFAGEVLVLQGDTPLTSPQTGCDLLDALRSQQAGMALLTINLENPYGYGRILRDAEGLVLANVEEKDATSQQKAIREVNPGVYAFDTQLWSMLAQVTNHNAAGEYYLPDLIALYRQAGSKVVAQPGASPDELRGVNSRAQLAEVEAILLDRLRQRWMAQGVRMITPSSIYLETSVQLAPDVTLWPGVVLRGQTRVGEGSEIGAYSVLTDTVVEAGASIKSHVVAEGAWLHGGSEAGPFARLRPGAVLEDQAHVGNFVEVKNAHLHRGVKAGHLAYLGDAEVGAHTNIGAGVITANYDGVRKNRTQIGRSAFIGSNSVLVAPVTVGDEALVAAGSTITQDVPPQALAVARQRQRVIEGYRERTPRESSEVE